MSETPRTDALIGRNRKLDKMTDVALYLAEIAESHADLERELAALTRERDEARAELELADYTVKESLCALQNNRKERDALRAEVERLRGVIPSLIVVQRMPNAEHVADAHNAAVRVLRAALTPAEVTK